MRAKYFLSAILLLTVSCSLSTPPRPVADNPFDPNNPVTHGHPYNLRAELVDGGVRLVWNRVAWEPLVGYSVYRNTDAGDFARIARLGLDTTDTDTTIQTGHRYGYSISVRSSLSEGWIDSVAMASVNSAPVLVINGANVTETPTRNVTLIQFKGV